MSIYIWGRGGKGEGWGHGWDHHEPTLLDRRIDDTTDPEWTQIECGRYHTVGLTKNGEVFTWGDNRYSNTYGQLGHGDEESKRVPTKVAGLLGLVIIKISCGGYYTVVLTDKGEMFTWGYGEYYQLGHNSRRHEYTPKKVKALGGEMIVDVVCGDLQTYAITSEGSVFRWGHVTGYGDNNIVPLPMILQDLNSKVVICASAFGHTACVTKAGEVFTWGKGSFGRLGHGDKNRQWSPKRVEALVGVKAKQVSCGHDHTAVCTEDGYVYTFGRGEYGELGHGNKENKTSPVLVQALEGKHITQVRCGWSYTMALTSSGCVFTWGKKEYGVLGHRISKVGCCSIPLLVEGLREHNVVQITTNYQQCAVLVDPTSPSSIRQSQQASFNNQELSDVVFMVDNQPLYANVDVLSQKSDYFAAMFRSKMRESIERVVRVPNCSSAAFLRVLEYLCLDDFTVSSIDDVVEVWVLADMYQLEGLKYSCMGALERGVCSKENVSEILQEVEELGCPCDELKRMCHECLAQEKNKDY